MAGGIMNGLERIGRLLATLVVVLAAACWLTAESASAHAAFDRSDPVPNAILPESPETIQVWFTEPLEFDYSSLAIYDERGAPVQGAASEPGDGDSSLLIRLASPLERGTYSVVWNNLSAADGHTNQGYMAFTVGTAADVTAVVAPAGSIDDDAPPLWLQTVARWLVLLSLAPIVAVWLIWLVVLRPAAGEDAVASTLADRTWSIAVVSLVAALVANVLALLVQAATLDRGSLVDRTIDLLVDTRYGELWIARIALLAAAGVVLEWVDWLIPTRRRLLTLLALLLTLALPVPISLNAHASAVTAGRTTAILFDWVHATAASVWLGGLVLLFAVLIRSDGLNGRRRVILASALPRFSATAIVCWGLLVLTGAYATWLQVGSLDALRNTDYGKSLIVKLILVAIVLAIAAINLLVITRRWIANPERATSRALSRTIAAEILLAVAIFMIVGRMTSLQPAHDANAAPVAASIELALDLEGHPATLSIIPGTPGPNHFVIDLPNETLPDDTEAVIELELIGGDLGINEIKLDRTTPTRFEWHGSELSAAGEWTAGVSIRSIGNFSWDGETSLTAGESGRSGTNNPWRLTTHSIAGLLLVALGLVGLVVGWLAGSKGLRKESALLGAAALVLGMGIMATDRVTPMVAGEIPARLPATEESIIQGAEIYSALCLSCHGSTGQGDGPGATGLKPPPADFTDLTAHNHDDKGWYTAVTAGVPGTAMPPFGEELTDDEIWHVINYIQAEFQS
jgi:copper transport protein